MVQGEVRHASTWYKLHRRAYMVEATLYRFDMGIRQSIMCGVQERADSDVKHFGNLALRLYNSLCCSLGAHRLWSHYALPKDT